MQPDRFARIVHHIIETQGETECAEFKENNENPQEIGENISALANSAALEGRERAYILWGIEDSTHRIVGTRFEPSRAKKGNESLENWLTRGLTPQLGFRFHTEYVDGYRVVLLDIPAAIGNVVRFYGEAFIRVASYTKPLEKHPEKEQRLWDSLRSRDFESVVVRAEATSQDVLGSLNVATFMELARRRDGGSDSYRLEQLASYGLLKERAEGDYDITNLAAVLLARDLREFGLERRALRIVRYEDRSRVATVREIDLAGGYASEFRRALGAILKLTPRSERIVGGIREAGSVYPEIAIRELLANALVHQDFSSTGSGPMVEVFSDRIEITNPGTPLIPIDRLLDLPPDSRNDKLAAVMRHLRICEERGSGVDKVITAIEAEQLPPPDFQTTAGHTRVILFSRRAWSEMTQAERIRAAYQHASLQWAQHDYLTNASLRKRFALGAEKASAVSRVISDAVSAGRIRLEGGAHRSARYVPYYVGEATGTFADTRPGGGRGA